MPDNIGIVTVKVKLDLADLARQLREAADTIESATEDEYRPDYCSPESKYRPDHTKGFATKGRGHAAS